MIVLDTHAFVWLIQANSRFGKQSTRLAENALEKNLLVVSAITFWELAMLSSRNKIVLPVTVERMRFETMQNGIREIPLDGSIAMRAVALANFHPDPADRFIVATAQSLDATLITADQKILDWPGELRRHHADK